MSTSENGTKKKRAICSRCKRPERTCICSALPDAQISLTNCQLVILQHPHEVKRKNRSLPLVELCIDDKCMHTEVGRRFGDQTNEKIMQLLQDEARPLMVVFPAENAVSLTEGLRQIRRYSQEKITVVILDGTWKHCREMHDKNQARKQYPPHFITVSLSKDDFCGDFRPARFDIRTPPSPQHLSTAECIAWIVAKLENEPTYYDVIMKPLDKMVEQWHSFSKQTAVFSFTGGDGNMMDEVKETKVTTLKKRKHAEEDS